MGRYELDFSTVLEFQKEIEQGQPVTAAVRDVEDMTWKTAQVIISTSPIQGGDSATVWGAGGFLYRPGDFYIKVLSIQEL